LSYQIGPWIYSPDKCLLTDGNTEVELEPLLVRLLTVFIANPDKIVTRAELIAEAWQQAFVDDNAINRAISELRRQMAHPLSKSGIIKTHYRKGYSLAVPVKAVVQITDSNNQVSTDQQTPVAHSAKKSNGLAIAIGFILFAIACTLAYLITTQKQQETKDMVITRTAELTAATWLLGKETSPQVSPDKAYLAFYNVHKGQTKSFVKRLSDNASSQVSHLDYRVSVFSWQPKSEILLAELVNKERGECFYGTFSTEQFPAVRFERFIKACNKEAIGMAQMSRDGSLLYYIDKDAAEIGYEVRQFSIDSKRDKILLPSYEVTYGIRLFALSPDGQKILYRREEQGERLKFFTYDLKTHENILVLLPKRNDQLLTNLWATALL